MAVEANVKANVAFAAGDFTDAINHFTDAINLAPTNHVLYSNRSAAYASLKQYSEALSDAKKTINLKPDWSKGYSRLGAAHHGLKQYDEAVLAYKKGLEVDPSNETLKSGLKDAESAKLGSGQPGLGSLFGDAFGSGMWAKLAADPATTMYMQQPDFVNMMKDLRQNPSNLNLYLQDQRVMPALGVLKKVKMAAGPGGPGGNDDDDVEMPDSGSSSPPKERKRPADDAEPTGRRKKRKERESEERKATAQKEKEKGNAAYKKKDFETAIECYTKAVELDDGDISFLTNRAAVYLEMGKFGECIKDCEKAVERGRELRSHCKMVARALTRKGTALVKMAKTSKDYEPAIETFQKALTEHHNPDTLKKLNDAERAKKELEQQKYYDYELAKKEWEKGNEFSKEQKYPDAIRHYTESLRRNPKGAKAYGNRAACYLKLGAMPEGLKDAEKCIEIDPKFSQGYTIKGAIQFLMKEFDKALETYQEGLKHDPSNTVFLKGVRSCEQKINQASRGDLRPDELKERQAKAMQDPEIQNILTDPVMAEDQRVMPALGVLKKVKMSAGPGGPGGNDDDDDDVEMPDSGSSSPSKERKRPADEAKTVKEKKREAEVEVDPMRKRRKRKEGELEERKANAQKEKEKANDAYKKDFETAIECYTKAVELDDGDISFLTNRAAVYLEMGKFDECTKDCEKAVERGRELRSDCKMVARALTRKGTALVKMAKTSKDYEPAIETFQKALTEHHNPDTLKQLNDAERAKKELEQQEYYDHELAEKEREKGNECSKEQKYPDAIRHYTEASRRNPKDAKAYGNRAACYTRLGAMPEGSKDAEKCIEINPKFSMGSSCVKKFNRASRGDLKPDELKERQAKAMQDPEIQNILTDPVMAQDQRVMQASSILLNLKMSAGPGGPGGNDDDDVEMPDSGSSSPPKERKRPVDEAEAVKEKKRDAEVEAEPMRRRRKRKEGELEERKANAQKEKEKGNAANKKDFETAIVCYTKAVETAIECYTKAVELDVGDILFPRNRAAVYLEMGKATIKAQAELDAASSSRPLNVGKEADPTTKLGNFNSLSASATTFITQQNAIQQHILELLESHVFNVNQVDSFSVKTALSVLNRMVDDRLIVKGCQLWCVATDLFVDAGKRELFVSMPDDDGRIAWLKHIAKKK